MDLKVKLQKPINKKQEEKRKWTRKNAGIYKIYAINNFFVSVGEWRNHLTKGWETSLLSPLYPLHFRKIIKSMD